MTGFITISFMILIAVGMPIGFVLGVSALAAMIKMELPSVLNLVPQRYFAGVDMFTLMAMPFFILAGEIMNKTGITGRLVRFSNVLVGHLQGGLAHANILASVLFNLLMREFVAEGAKFSTHFTGETNFAQKIYSRAGFHIVARFVGLTKEL